MIFSTQRGFQALFRFLLPFPLVRNCLQVESQGNYRVHFTYVHFPRDHNHILPEMLFYVFCPLSSYLQWEDKSGSCYHIMAETGHTHIFKQSFQYFTNKCDIINVTLNTGGKQGCLIPPCLYKIILEYLGKAVRHKKNTKIGNEGKESVIICSFMSV